MESYSIVIILLAVAIGLSPIASKMKLPYPVLLLAAGIGVGCIPGFHRMTVNPDVVFLLFLPPMLYDASFKMPFKDFRANISTISLLAVSLIFISATVIAVVAHYCIPTMTWPLSFVLGAILSPPDAIAATSVTKGLSLPRRTSTIIEGESLVNDASALVAFKFAVAAVAGVAFVPWKAGLIFLMAIGGGFLVGWAIYVVYALLLRRYRTKSDVTVSLNLLVPFVAYLLAEQFHVSGVIAVVTAGLIMAMNKHKFTEQERSQSAGLWRTVIFVLGGLVFLLIGMEFPRVLRNMQGNLISRLLWVAVLIFVMAMAIRMLIIFRHRSGQAIRVGRARRRGISMPMQGIIRRRRRRLMEFKPLSTKECIIIGWSGMRGIVSLAAALSLPLLMKDGRAFPHRDTIIFLTVVTVIIMLTVQGMGLPLILKWLKIDDKTEEKKEE